MIKLRVYDTVNQVYKQDAIPIDRDFEQSFRDLLQGGWFREELCGEILETLTGARWQADQDYALVGPEGESHCAACLPAAVRLALTVAVNSRRGIWTMIPRGKEFDWHLDTPYGLPGIGVAGMWDYLAMRQENFLLIVGVNDGSDQGLLKTLMERDHPLWVSFHGHRCQGPADEVFRTLVRPAGPMELLGRINRCIRQMPLEWPGPGPEFTPRYAQEMGMGNWQFQNFLTAEPYCPEESWPLLSCRTPAFLMVTQDRSGRFRLEQPFADTLREPELPLQTLVYDNLLASCTEGLGQGEWRAALVLDAAPWQLGQDSSYLGLCFGFVLDEAERRVDLYEGRGALQAFRKALAELLRWQEKERSKRK